MLLTAIGLLATLAAAVAAWRGAVTLSVLLWLFGRLCDGIDGVVARLRHRSTEVGAALDITADAIGYAAIPLGIAFAVGTRATWIATAVVLAAFYVNAMSLGYVAAVLERRRARQEHELTAVAVPAGIVEGTETIVLFTVALAVPARAAWVWWAMAVLVVLTAGERMVRLVLMSREGDR